MDLGMERVRELRARRDELRETLSKLVPLRPPPPQLFTAATRQRFQGALRELFLEGNALAKHDLDFLVAEVVVAEGDVIIRGKREAVLSMMAAGSASSPLAPSPAFTPTGEVLTSVGDWLRL